MSVVKFAVGAAAIGLGVLGWQKHQQHLYAQELAAITDTHGFIEMPPPEGMNNKTVMVMAAVNCPHEAALQADWLAQQLADRGMSYQRGSHVSLSLQQFSNEEEAEPLVRHFNTLMESGAPLVFINGRAKHNPDLDEVIAEYNEAQSL